MKDLFFWVGRIYDLDQEVNNLESRLKECQDELRELKCDLRSEMKTSHIIVGDFIVLKDGSSVKVEKAHVFSQDDQENDLE